MDQQTSKILLTHLRHELRTPLNAILGYSELLLEESPDTLGPDVVLSLQQVHTTGKKLLDRISHALDPAVLGDADFNLYAPNLCRDLGPLLDRLLPQIESLLQGAAEHPGAGDFLGDMKRIQQAGQNLSDQVHDQLTRCQAASARAAGAWPVLGLASGVAQYVQSQEITSQAACAKGAGGCLLAVDDNEMNLDVLSRRLHFEGHTVTPARSGPEALDLVRTRPFDLILLDILMPGMSGLEVLAQLKQDPELRHIPVLMISALDEMASVIRSIEMGAEDYLAKPFEPALLRARVGACLEKKRLRDREVQYLKEIEAQRARADGLLCVILPALIAQELKDTNDVKPRRFENVAIMFCDIVGFTPYCDKRYPEEVLGHLQSLVVAFEELALEHHIQKIKTIGDAFMATCGLLEPDPNPVLSCVRCAVQMIARSRQHPASWELRIGIHFGPVVAGVLGKRQFQFDLWGDTVNTAARMESHGVPGGITLSESAYRQIGEGARCDCLGVTRVKGKGDLSLYQFREFLPEAAGLPAAANP